MIQEALECCYRTVQASFVQPIQQQWVELQLARDYPHICAGETLGRYGERLAGIYLQRKGYFLLEHSFRTKSGEIDLVAVWKRKTVVFVEVKTWNRPHENAGGPSDAVDEPKQEKITRTALSYMKRHRLLNYPGRADVVEIILGSNPRRPMIRHFENAFEAVGRYQMYS